MSVGRERETGYERLADLLPDYTQSQCRFRDFMPLNETFVPLINDAGDSRQPDDLSQSKAPTPPIVSGNAADAGSPCGSPQIVVPFGSPPRA
jgi:hypothetical protein